MFVVAMAVSDGVAMKEVGSGGDGVLAVAF